MAFHFTFFRKGKEKFRKDFSHFTLRGKIFSFFFLRSSFSYAWERYKLNSFFSLRSSFSYAWERYKKIISLLLLSLYIKSMDY